MQLKHPDISVCLLQPTGYVHSLALLEAAEYVAAKCSEANYRVSLQKNRISRAGINIVFGAHLEPQRVQQFPENIVVFNTEQLTAESVWTQSSYIEVLKSRPIFDYSETNLACIPHERKWLIPFLFCKSLRRLKKNLNPEFDLLFYGSMNEHRRTILHALKSAGLNVLHLQNVYGSSRDKFLINARAVLNLHFYASQIFQQIRAFYPLTNGIPVISEAFPNESVSAIYNNAVFGPKKESLIDYIVGLQLGSNRFNEESDRRISLFEDYNQDDQFFSAIDTALKNLSVTHARVSSPCLRPTSLNLGSGKDYKTGFFNIDINPATAPDALLDLSKEHNFPIEVENYEGVPVRLGEEQLDEIIAFDVLEHVPELVRLMTNCLNLLKTGGKFQIRVPYDLSYGAWQDPTHVRAFNEKSWLYYTDWSWYLGWNRARFRIVEMKYELSSFGQSLIAGGQDSELVIRTPRAVDSLFVVLQKTALNAEEETLVSSYSPGIFSI